MPEFAEVRYKGEFYNMEFDDDEVKEIKEVLEKRYVNLARKLLLKYNIEEQDDTKKIPPSMLAVMLQKLTKPYYFELQNRATIIIANKKNEE